MIDLKDLSLEYIEKFMPEKIDKKVVQKLKEC
jgi:archaellum component FlaD/FlaE